MPRPRSNRASSPVSTDADSDTSGDEADNWVQCDACNKWRRIPHAVYKKLGEDAKWYCELNPHKQFASCSVPQEMSDQQIDAGGSSDDEEETLEDKLKRRRIPPVWQQLKDNRFGHRKRKVQDEDDIMICHCKPVWRGGDGCGPDCINRMLCIECVPGFCPCEDKCTNQHFSKKQFASLEVKRAGRKGFGLFAKQDIKAGQFIIEYVGEVLEEDEYTRRKEFYQEIGQRHYYFMNVGNGEVIDACRKGNISRFINHSCDPNCETQKWLVKGELAIGLFALKDIAKDEELTFDYNFERYGDRPMRCYCSSKNCRKFIGGTQDVYDERMLIIEPEDATNDLPPLMVTDSEMDANVRIILDWRVGNKVEKSKLLQALPKLHKLCKKHNIDWTPAYFHGLPLSLPTSAPTLQPELQPAIAAQAQPAAKKPSRKAQAKATAATGTAAGTATATAAAATPAPSGTAAGVPVSGAQAGMASTPAVTGAAPAGGDNSSDAMYRGPLKGKWKALHKQKQVSEPATSPSPPPEANVPAGDVTEQAAEPAATAPARKRLVRTADLKQQKQQEQLEADELADEELPPATATTAKAAQLTTAIGDATPVPRASSSKPKKEVVAASSSLVSEATKYTASSAQASSTAVQPPRSTPMPRQQQQDNFLPPYSAAGAKTFKKRSEIDRRLDSLLVPSGRLKDASKQNIIKVLRMFNLCDIGPSRVARPEAPPPVFLPPPPVNGRRPASIEPGEVPVPKPDAPATYDSPASPTHDEQASMFAGASGSDRDRDGGVADDAQGGKGLGFRSGGGMGYLNATGNGVVLEVTARQKARMADLSLLLDVLLKTTSTQVKKDFVACGMLQQLLQVIGHNLGKEYVVSLRKILRVVESLPLAADDIYTARNAHGTFADVLRTLSSHTDYDIRTKADALLKKYPLSAVSDPAIVQMHTQQSSKAHRAAGGRPDRPHEGETTTNRPRILRPLKAPAPGPSPTNDSSVPSTAVWEAPGSVRLQRTGSSTLDLPESARGVDSPAYNPPPSSLPPLAPKLRSGPGRPMRPTMAPPPLAPDTAPRGIPPGGPPPRIPPSPYSHTPGTIPNPQFPRMPPPLPPFPTPHAHPHPYHAAHGPHSVSHEPPAEDPLGWQQDPPAKRRRRGFSDRPPSPDLPPYSQQPPLPYDAPDVPGYRDPRDRHHSHSHHSQHERDLARYTHHPHHHPHHHDPRYPQPLPYPDHTRPPDINMDSRHHRPYDPYHDHSDSPDHHMSPTSPPPPPPADEPPAPRTLPPLTAEELFLLKHIPEHVQLPPAEARTASTSELEPTSAVLLFALGVYGSSSSSCSAASQAAADDPAFSPIYTPSSWSPVRPLKQPEEVADMDMTWQETDAAGVEVTPQVSMPLVVDLRDLRTAAVQSQQAATAAKPTTASSRSELHAQAAEKLHGKQPASKPGSRQSPLLANGSPAIAVDIEAVGARGLEDWSRPISNDHADSWSEPNEAFSAFLSDIVRHRLGKYAQPDHPKRITLEDAAVLHSKIHKEVMDKERQAWAERQSQGLEKPIDRRKLESNLKEFVRLSIRKYHSQQPAATTAAPAVTPQVPSATAAVAEQQPATAAPQSAVTASPAGTAAQELPSSVAAPPVSAAVPPLLVTLPPVVELSSLRKSLKPAQPAVLQRQQSLEASESLGVKHATATPTAAQEPVQSQVAEMGVALRSKSRTPDSHAADQHNKGLGVATEHNISEANGIGQDVVSDVNGMHNLGSKAVRAGDGLRTEGDPMQLG